MKLFSCFSSRTRKALQSAGFVVMVLSSVSALASPGAHGPNGEHLDAPAQSGGSAGAAPGFEARSEAFELVGRLQGGELSILINRFATNEPVLNAVVEVESGALKAPARFHADMGDYAIDDVALLKALSAPGQHPVVVTLLAGPDSDLLDGTLVVAGAPKVAAGHTHGGGQAPDPWLTAWLALALVVLVVLGWFLGRPSKADAASPQKGAL